MKFFILLLVCLSAPSFAQTVPTEQIITPDCINEIVWAWQHVAAILTSLAAGIGGTIAVAAKLKK